MSRVFKKIILIKEVYCNFCQLALLNISSSVETASGSQCNSLFLAVLIANMAMIYLIFSKHLLWLKVFNISPLNF